MTGGLPAPELSPVAASADRGRNAALTAVGQVFVLVGASLIGLVVAATLSPGPRLDAYFTASQLSVAALYVGQALRTSVPGLTVSGVVRLPILARAALVMTGAVAVVLLLAVVIGPYLLPDASRTAMRSDLLVLFPGAVLQVGAGYAAGRLAMVGRFAGAAVAYASGTLLNAVLLVSLVDAEGAKILAPSALAGWVVSATIIGVLLWKTARALKAAPAPVAQDLSAPESADAESAVGVLGAAGRIGLSVVPVLGAQLVIVASVTAAASVRSGGSTLFAFAFLALNAVGTVAVAPIPIVLSADLGTTWDRRAESLIPLMLSVVRLSVAVMMPLVLGLVLVGRPVADVALGGLTPADVEDLFAIVLVLLPSLPLTAAGMVALVAVLAQDRLGVLARLVTLIAGGAAATIAVIAVAGGSLMTIAIAASLWSAVLGGASVAVALRGHTLRTVAGVFDQAARVAAPGLVVLAAALLTGGGLSLLSGILWTAAGVLLHLAWLRWRYPAELATLSGAVIRR